MDIINDKELTKYIQRARCRSDYIPSVFRAKFLPFKLFVDFIDERIADGDFRPVLLYFETKMKKTSNLPDFKICVACAKKRFFSMHLKRYLCENGPCDLERIQNEPTPEPQRKRFIDIAIGPDSPGFEKGWVQPEAKKRHVEEQQEPERVLTDEEKQEQMVQILRKKEEPPPSAGYGFLGALRMMGRY